MDHGFAETTTRVRIPKLSTSWPRRGGGAARAPANAPRAAGRRSRAVIQGRRGMGEVECTRGQPASAPRPQGPAASLGAVASPRRRPRRTVLHCRWLKARIAVGAVATALTVVAWCASPGAAGTAREPHLKRVSLAQPMLTSALPTRTYINHFTPHGYEMLVIGPADQYTQLINSGEISIEGTVRDAGQGRLMFVEATGGRCPGQPGVYSVSLEPKGAFLTAVQDRCPDRVSDFSSSLWKPYTDRTSAAG